jgi:hypothetical protein
MWYFKHLKSIQTFYWGLYGPANQVHFCSRLALSGFMIFYFQMFKLASFIWTIPKERIRSFLGMHLEEHARALIFQHRFGFFLWLPLCLTKILCKPKFQCLATRLVIPFFGWSLKFWTLCTILSLPILQLVVFLDAYVTSS